MNAYAYLRVSGLGQVDGFGFERQLDTVQSYATKNGFEVVNAYREEGVSGKTEMDDRPALQQLIADMLSNSVKTVIIEKLDRIARDVIVQETIIRQLMSRGLTVISATEPDLCSEEPTRVLIRQILGAFFEFERKLIVAKLADARKRKRLSGQRCEGVKPYGEKDGERNILALILKLGKEGKSHTLIAAALNDLGVPTRSLRPWKAYLVSRILRRACA